jgi:hypothetical protein
MDANAGDAALFRNPTHEQSACCVSFDFVSVVRGGVIAREADEAASVARCHGSRRYTAAIASISSKKFGLASPRRTHNVLPGGCAPK